MSKKRNIKIFITLLTLCFSTLSLCNASAMKFKQIEIETPKNEKKEAKEKRKYDIKYYSNLEKLINKENSKAKAKFASEVKDLFEKIKYNNSKQKYKDPKLIENIINAYLKNDLFKYCLQFYKLNSKIFLIDYKINNLIEYMCKRDVEKRKNECLKNICLNSDKKLDKEKFIEIIKRFIEKNNKIDCSNIDFTIPESSEKKLEEYFNKQEENMNKLFKEVQNEYNEITTEINKNKNEKIVIITPKIIEKFKKILLEKIPFLQKKMIDYLETKIKEKSSIEDYISWDTDNYAISNCNKNTLLDFMGLTKENKLDIKKFIDELKRLKLIDINSNYIINKEEELDLLTFIRKFKPIVEKESSKERTDELFKKSPIIMEYLNSLEENSKKPNENLINEKKTLPKKEIEQFKKILSEKIPRLQQYMINYLEKKINENSFTEKNMEYEITNCNKKILLDYISLTKENKLDIEKFIDGLKKLKLIDINSNYVISKEEELDLLIFFHNYKSIIEKEFSKERTDELLEKSLIIKNNLFKKEVEKIIKEEKLFFGSFKKPKVEVDIEIINKNEDNKKINNYEYYKIKQELVAKEFSIVKQKFASEIKNIFEKIKYNNSEQKYKNTKLIENIIDAFLNNDLFKYIKQDYEAAYNAFLTNYQKMGVINSADSKNAKSKQNDLFSFICLDKNNLLNKEKFIKMIRDFIESAIKIDCSNIDFTIPKPYEKKLEEYFYKNWENAKKLYNELNNKSKKIKEEIEKNKKDKEEEDKIEKLYEEWYNKSEKIKEEIEKNKGIDEIVNEIMGEEIKNDVFDNKKKNNKKKNRKKKNKKEVEKNEFSINNSKETNIETNYEILNEKNELNPFDRFPAPIPTPFNIEQYSINKDEDKKISKLDGIMIKINEKEIRNDVLGTKKKNNNKNKNK